jgi:hypothetical protein
MNFSAFIPSVSLGAILDALLHPSVGKLPAGFLLLTLAVLGIAALPDEKRSKLKMAIMAAFGLFLSMEFSWPLNWGVALG